MITSDEKIASLFIIQYKGKDAAEHLDTFWSILIIEIENYLTIRFGLPVMCIFQFLSKGSKVFKGYLYSKRFIAYYGRYPYYD